MSQAIIKVGGASFHPSAANTGNEQATVLRGKNMFLRGSDGSYYFEAFPGIKSLREPIPVVQLNGTVSYTNGSTAVTGVGTDFKDELRFGQKFIAGDPTQVFVVEDILSATSLIVQRAPDASGAAQAAYKLPHLFEIDNKRGTLIWGNAIKWDRGNITAVGEGRLRINGDVLPGESMTATRRMQIALFDPATQQFDVGQMGFDTAPPANGVSVSVVAGGTRDMTQGEYSFRWAWANSKTGYGFSNPSEVVKLDAFNNPIAVTATNQRFQLDFTAGLASKPTNADAIIVYRSLYSDAAQNLVQAAEGSWFVAATTLISALEAGDILYVDVLDGELSSEVSFDNDPPPNADWMSALAGDPILISCYGDTVVGGDERGDAPGPQVSIARRGNRDGYPAALATALSPPETIIGFLPAVGRLFLMTRTGLPFAASTGQADFPVETRAFWTTRFKSPYGLVFWNGDLYAFTITGPTRSIGTGDRGADQINFSAAVEDITRNWHAGYVHVVYDPQNEAILFVHSAAYRDEDGFWVSEVLPYSLRHNTFTPLIEIKKAGRDMIVCGAATIGSHVQFLAGGRGDVDTFSSEESSSEEPIDYIFLNPDAASFCCTGACGLNVHTAGSEVGDGEISIDDTDPRGDGTHAIRFVANGTSGGAQWGPHNLNVSGLLNDGYSVRCYIKFDTLPTNLGIIVQAFNSPTFFPSVYGVIFDPADNTLKLGAYNTLPLNYNYNASGSEEINVGQWYRIDIRWYQVSSNIIVDCQIDGVDIDSYSASNSSGITMPRVSTHMVGYHNQTTEFQLADFLLITDKETYPLGPGHVRRYKPNADGTHNITTAGDFKVGGTVTNITNATTDSYELIDETPSPDNGEAVSGDDFIRQTADTATGALQYVEHTFANPDGYTPDLPPRIVHYIAGHHIASGGTGAGKCVLVDGATAAEVVNMATQSDINIRTNQQGYVVAPGLETPWEITGGEGNALTLKHRFGFATDAAVDIALDALMLEMEFPGDS